MNIPKRNGLKQTPLKRRKVSFLAKVKPNQRKTKVRAPKVSWLTKRPPKPRKPHQIRIDPLDELFSLYIRLRDGYTCQRCGVKSKNTQCCHFHSRRKISVRFDPDNAICGCYGCHSWLDGNPMEKVEFFKHRLGKRKFNMLNSRMRITYPKPDRKAIELYLKQQIKLLEESK